MISYNCVGCGKKPEQLEEFAIMGKEYDQTAEEYLIKEEGTLNKENGHFYCTDCYIKAGMPLGRAK